MRHFYRSVISHPPVALQITVPVTIEHPPPELRLMSSPPAQVLHEQQQQQQLQRPPPVPRQDTLHTDSGLDTEEIVPASPPRPPEQLVGRPNCPKSAQADEQRTATAAASAIPALGAVCDDDVIIDGVRMVLVRDIGVQVCGDSPLLNSTREEQLIEFASM